MTRRDFIWKWASYSVVLVVVTILNYNVLTLLPLGAVPGLLPTLAVAVGILEGAAAGAGFGLAAGVMQAAATHGSFGWVVVLAAAGWLCGLLAQYVLRRDIVGYLLACLVAGLLREGLEVGLRLLVGTAELSVLLQVAIPEYVWTIVFSIPVYGMCHFCCQHYGRIYHE
jgi:uncharacterized membrane protein